MSAPGHDPFDLQAGADEVHSALLSRQQMRKEAARGQVGDAVAPDVWRRAGRLYEWHPAAVRAVQRGAWRGTGVWCNGGEPVLITPKRVEELVAETVAMVEADRKRYAGSANAQVLLRFWNAWGRRLPPAVAQRALSRAEVRTWAYPELTGRAS